MYFFFAMPTELSAIESHNSVFNYLYVCKYMFVCVSIYIYGLIGRLYRSKTCINVGAYNLVIAVFERL